MMASNAIGTGLILIALGAWGYFGADVGHRSGTAWIPAGFGVPLILLGVLGFKEHLRKHVMHAAATVGLLGFLGSAIMVVRKVVEKGCLEGRGPMAQLAMAVVCAAFVGLGVNSFIQARRARKRREQAASGSS